MNWPTVTKEKLLLLVSLKLSQPCTRKYGSMFVTSPTPSSHLTFGWQLETNAVIERKSVCTHIIKWLLDTQSLFPSPPTGTALWNKAIPFWKKFLRSATHTSPPIWAALVPLWSAYVLLKASNTSNRTGCEPSMVFILWGGVVDSPPPQPRNVIDLIKWSICLNNASYLVPPFWHQRISCLFVMLERCFLTLMSVDCPLTARTVLLVWIMD